MTGAASKNASVKTAPSGSKIGVHLIQADRQPGRTAMARVDPAPARTSNRFSSFPCRDETAEAVPSSRAPNISPLTQGVNEICIGRIKNFSISIFSNRRASRRFPERGIYSASTPGGSTPPTSLTLAPVREAKRTEVRALLVAALPRCELFWLAALMLLLTGSNLFSQPLPNQTWLCTLVEGSQLVDECPPCDRIPIVEPLRGTFELTFLDDNSLFTRYRVHDIAFVAAANIGRTYKVTGEGIYSIGGEVAVLQDLKLQVWIDDGLSNKLCFFTNAFPAIDRLRPMISSTVDQTNGTFAQTYHLTLEAAPLREIWFSTASGFTSAHWQSPTNHGGNGDLLSASGRIVKANDRLLGQLGFMPGTAPMNIDAVSIASGGEILFSLDQDAWSETLGQIHEGDLLSDRGKIVQTSSALMAAFNPQPQLSDYGLDALMVMPDGEILFSITTNVFSPQLLSNLTRGDILSDRGRIYRTNQDLLARFHPLVKTNVGLDALYVWPSGEIWFSTEQGFNDQQLGQITSGDLLSDQGRIIFRIRELMFAFAPLEDLANFGLDALYLVTDVTAAAPPPTIVSLIPDSQSGDV